MFSLDICVSTSGLLWWFDEANQVKKFKTLWSYVECMKIEELGLELGSVCCGVSLRFNQWCMQS